MWVSWSGWALALLLLHRVTAQKPWHGQGKGAKQEKQKQELQKLVWGNGK